MSSSIHPGGAPFPPTSRRTRVLVTGAVLVLGIVTTSVVSISIDRMIWPRAAVGGDDEHGDHGEEAAHGEESHAEHADGEEGHDKKPGHDDHAAKGAEGEHTPHVDIATVELTEPQIANAKLEFEMAGPGRVDETLSLPGEVTLNADAVAHVTPRSSGAVRSVKAVLGDVVKKGDVLAVLDSREVAGMQQEALAAQARLELAQANYDRIEKLFRDQISSEKDYLTAKQALAEAKIDRNSAMQKLAAGAGPSAGGSGFALVAPIDGTVIEKHINIGEVLDAEKQAFTIADLSTLWVMSTAHAREMARVEKGQRAYIRVDGTDASVEGKIDYVEATLGERTRTARLRIVVEKPPATWKPGMFVTTELVVGGIDAPVVILEDAVQRLGDHEVVFVQDDGRFEARPVELGKPGRDAKGRPAREVSAGLPANARYVSKNAFALKAQLGKGSATHEH
jgi:cobalt-zinc-cadmium efflux system membrane fusion protein